MGGGLSRLPFVSHPVFCPKRSIRGENGSGTPLEVQRWTFVLPIRSFWGLAKKGRFYERNRHFFGSSDCAFRYLAAPADAPAETTDGRVRITKDVPILRIDHISAKGKLLGVWPFSYARNQKHEDEGD